MEDEVGGNNDIVTDTWYEEIIQKYVNEAGVEKMLRNYTAST